MIVIKRYYIEYLLSFLFLLSLSACKKETVEIASVNEQDSIQIAEYFNLTAFEDIEKDYNQFSKQHVLVDTNLNTKLFFYNQLSVSILKTGQFQEAEALIRDSILSHSYLKNFQIGKSYNILGNVLFYSKKVEECIDAFHNAAQLFYELNNFKEYGSVQLNLGNIFLSQLNFPLVYKYAETAYDVLGDIEDDAEYLYPLSASFLAIASLKLEEHYDRVEFLIQEASELNKDIKHPQVDMLIEYAKAELDIKNQNYLEAIDHFEQSISIAKSLGDQNFITIASTSIIFCHYHLKQYEEVIDKGSDLLEKANLDYFKDILYALHKHLGNSYNELGNYEMAYVHITEAEKHFREKINSENQMIVQDLIVKYDSENKEFKIDQQALAIQRGKYLIWSLIILTSLIVIIFLLYFYIKNRNLKQKMLLSLQEGESKERQRLSNELHDGLASDLVGLKMLLEIESDACENPTKFTILINKMHADIRKIAHDLAPIDFTIKSLSKAINEWLTQYDGNGQIFTYQSNFKDVYVGYNTSAIVYRIVQEVIQNALKHAHSHKINVTYYRFKNRTSITIDDNGSGVDADNMYLFSEKTNMLNERMEAFGGSITYTTNPNSGTQVILNF